MTREEKLEAILREFETNTQSDTNKPGENLRHALDSSPDLKERVLESVDKDQLKHFGLLPADANAGGTYDPTNHTMNLPRDTLDLASSNKASMAELVFVTGHEIQHSLNSLAYVNDAEKKFTADAWKIASGPGPHDYTAAIKDKLKVNRKDEAEANLGGFNALASQVEKNTPGAALADIYRADKSRMKDFVDVSGSRGNHTYRMKPGLVLDHGKDGKPIMHITATPQNVEAMGKQYFDKSARRTHLGTYGNQDYKDYYGEGALAVVNTYEKQVADYYKAANPSYTTPGVSVNLHELGLDKTLLDPGLHYNDTSHGAHPVVEAADAQPSAKGPFGDPALDKAFYAMQAGNDAQISHAAQQLQNSPEGQRLTQAGTQLLAEQQRLEQFVQTQAAPAQMPGR